MRWELQRRQSSEKGIEGGVLKRVTINEVERGGGGGKKLSYYFNLKMTWKQKVHNALLWSSRDRLRPAAVPTYSLKSRYIFILLRTATDLKSRTKAFVIEILERKERWVFCLVQALVKCNN